MVAFLYCLQKMRLFQCPLKYEYLFSTISKQNARSLNANLRDGWEIIDEDVELFYVVFQLNRAQY